MEFATNMEYSHLSNINTVEARKKKAKKFTGRNKRAIRTRQYYGNLVMDDITLFTTIKISGFPIDSTITYLDVGNNSAKWIKTKFDFRAYCEASIVELEANGIDSLAVVGAALEEYGPIAAGGLYESEYVAFEEQPDSNVVPSKIFDFAENHDEDYTYFKELKDVTPKAFVKKKTVLCKDIQRLISIPELIAGGCIKEDFLREDTASVKDSESVLYCYNNVRIGRFQNDKVLIMNRIKDFERRKKEFLKMPDLVQELILEHESSNKRCWFGTAYANQGKCFCQRKKGYRPSKLSICAIDGSHILENTGQFNKPLCDLQFNFETLKSLPRPMLQYLFNLSARFTTTVVKRQCYIDVLTEGG